MDDQLCQSAAKHAVGERQLLSCRGDRSRSHRVAYGANEWRRGIGCDDLVATDSLGQGTGEGTWTAADVEDLMAEPITDAFKQSGRERHGEPAHELRVCVGRHVEAHPAIVPG